MIEIGITGANGRMGKALIREVLKHPELRLSGASVREGSPWEGKDLGGMASGDSAHVVATSDLDALCARCAVVIDFTQPESTARLLSLARRSGTALVLGTTGFDAAQQLDIAQAARDIPIFRSANMSVGVNLLALLVERAARTLGPEYDIEVLEMHHRDKVDAPSGTALMLGQAAADGRAVVLEAVAEKVRDGITGARTQGNIGFATLRGGDVVGDHSVIFAGPGERIELAHRASSRALFAQGAVRAAAWLADKPAGLYGMRDMLAIADDRG